jgi:hypothetical protein
MATPQYVRAAKLISAQSPSSCCSARVLPSNELAAAVGIVPLDKDRRYRGWQTLGDLCQTLLPST